MNIPLKKTDAQNLIHEVRRLRTELDACTQAGQRLNARVEPSLAENERLREKVNQLQFDYDDVCKRIDYWATTVINLRAALEKFGAHGMDCSVVLGKCDCGLDQALKGGE